MPYSPARAARGGALAAAVCCLLLVNIKESAASE
jgi:hypothetical protein